MVIGTCLAMASNWLLADNLAPNVSTRSFIILYYYEPVSIICIPQTADRRPSTKCRIGINCGLKLQTWYKMQTVKKHLICHTVMKFKLFTTSSFAVHC